MLIAIGSNLRGLRLKEYLKVHMLQMGYYPIDCGDSSDHASISQTVGLMVARGEAERGMLVCDTGVGMAVAANKIPGVQAALCYDEYSAERAATSGAQILTLGSQLVGPATAVRLFDSWLTYQPVDERAVRRVAKLQVVGI
ncbi:MAG: RpiB/LacA/LacB family sugar-phosphate isomerase [Chloroflexota bacterium]